MGKVTGFKEFTRKDVEYRSVKARSNDYDEIFINKSNKDNLRQQGARCMDCGIPFCQSENGCPVDNLIPEWNDLIYNNKWKEALTRLHKTNNFPEFTGRVCPAPCESSCVLGIIDLPVTIKNIEQEIIDYGFKKGWVKSYKVKQRSDKKVAIIGSGPAGLAAADELNKLGHNITVFERDDRIGGLLMYGIPNMKLDKKIVDFRVNLLKDSGIKFVTNTDIGKDIKISKLKQDFDALILATGATKSRDLLVDNRDASGIVLAMDYLTKNTKSLLDFGKAEEKLSAKGKDVIVIGGGDTGADCIATALRQGAKSIINFELMKKPSIEREDNNPWPLWPLIYRVDYAHKEAHQLFGKDVREYQIMTESFVKDKNGKVCGIKTINVDSNSNNGELIKIKNSEKIWDAQLVLLSMGFVSPEHYLSDDANIDIDKYGNYKAEYNQYLTSKEKIFAAGDCRRGQSLVVWAINEGRGVAAKVNEYLTKT